MKIQVHVLQTIEYGTQYSLEFSSGTVLLNYYHESQKRTMYVQKVSSPELKEFMVQYSEEVREGLDTGSKRPGADFKIKIRSSKSTPSEQKGFVLFTDGGSNPNPGRGAAAWIIRDPKGRITEGAKYFSDTTNNRMEIMAVIEGLRRIPSGAKVSIYLDSQYVQKGMEEWMEYWKQSSWQTKRCREVMNRDLWEKLDKLAGDYRITWQWVRGHSGHTENEQCDALVRTAIKKGRSI